MESRKLQYLNYEYGSEKLINLYNIDNIEKYVVDKKEFLRLLDLNINLPQNMFVAGGRIICSLLGLDTDNMDYDIFSIT